LEHRMAGPAPLLLLDIGEIGRLAHRRPHLVAGAADHQHHLSAEGAAYRNRVLDEGPAAERVEDLGAAGAHALGVAGSQDDDGEGWRGAGGHTRSIVARGMTRPMP